MPLSPAYPSCSVVAKITIGVQLLSAVWNFIHDCDETFNYWEPLHFLLHSKGCQTWEYSPEFGLRSYAYVWLMGWPAALMNYLGAGKRVEFYAVRCYFALMGSGAQVYLYSSLTRKLRDPTVGLLTWFFLLFSAGNFVSSTAFLPSSTAMHCSTLLLAAWVDGRTTLAIGSVAVSTLLAWPFSLVLGVPLALDVLLRHGQWKQFLFASAGLGAALTTLIVSIDWLYYREVTFAPLNIVLYNVFNAQAGSHLYGVEPWQFYVKNYFLNFNVAVALTVLMPVVALLYAYCSAASPSEPQRKGKLQPPALSMCFLMLPLLLWNVVFFLQPHKEERFLFPCYPFLALGAAYGLHCCYLLAACVTRRLTQFHYFLSNSIYYATAGVFVALSAMRVLALLLGYSGALRIYSNLHDLPTTEKAASRNLCLAEEWYRFPSHFHLPDAWNLKFLESSFRGQLPAFYADTPDATWKRPGHFNALNKEEVSRYAQVTDCDYLIHTSETVTAEWRGQSWKTVNSTWFLSVDHSPAWSRAFYFPLTFWKRNHFKGYVLYQRVEKLGKMSS